MLYTAKSIKNTLTLLSKYAENINEKTEIIKAKNRFITDLQNTSVMLKELQYTIREDINLPIGHRDLRSMEDAIREMIPRIRNIQDGEQLRLKSLVSMLSVYASWNFEEFELYKTKPWVRYLDNGVYDENREKFSIETADEIMRNINTNRPYNIFSPKCRDGENVRLLGRYGEATTYGLESNDRQHAIARDVLNRVIKGDMNGSKISNDCFDIMHIVPEVSWMAETGATGNLLEKREKAMVRNTIKYLRKDGILIVTLPATRVTKDMAFVFARLLKDVQILRAGTAGLPYVHILGKKDITKETRQDVYAYLSEVPNMNLLPSTLDFSYNLASGGIKQPELFRGSILDESELIALINSSGLKNSFWKQHEIEERDDSMRPLLPSNMGQIGLVLTSGCLDGVVEEFEGQYHAIKGMVTKIRDFNNTTENNDETSVETISNKVQINLLTPDGKFIELA